MYVSLVPSDSYAERAEAAEADLLISPFGLSGPLSAGAVKKTTLKTTPNKKNDPQKRVVLVGLPGFEPRMTGPESVVLPLHHSPIFLFDGAKVEYYFVFTKKIAKKIHIFVKIFVIIRVKLNKTD